MDRIVIEGGQPLRGEVRVRGAKNSALPLMAATLLADAPVVLRNVPFLYDVFTMDKILSRMGLQIDFSGQTMTIDPDMAWPAVAEYDLVRKMRASFFVLGPMLGKFGEARVSLPGGCAIGTRPVDIHLKGLQGLSVDIEIEEGYVSAKGRPKGGVVALDFPSVGATENLIMAAARAEGTTEIRNAAREPEIADLADLLNAMGAQIEGAGTDHITIQGVDALGGAEHEVIPDRIETGTFLIAGAATGGDVTVENARADHLPGFLEKLSEAGATVEVDGSRIRVAGNGRMRAVDVSTQPYPGFPTDLQAQTMALLCTAEGASVVREVVFENRFMHVAELMRMGANIEVDGNTAIIRGVEALSSAPVMVSDLRAGAALVIAGAMANRGETVINRVYHIDRGYERIEERLAHLGARIRREHD